ncbi:MAG: hypothetical protein HY935_03360 [Nitrosomonadales bacterium]|nr:hypothetical protein [Nitrosomonadales bacterium]
MKDQQDGSTVDFVSPEKTERVAQRRAPPSGWCKVKPQPKRGNWRAREVREVDSGKVPALPGALHWESRYVPVSFVAKDWSVTPRRIRSLLTAKRLEGRRLDNGYWEVAYPYRFIIGTRGPVLKRQQKPTRGRPKAELRAV